jgi:hypothetical protein
MDFTRPDTTCQRKSIGIELAILEYRLRLGTPPNN